MNRTFITLLPFLLLLFFGKICSAMIVPFITFFLFDGLGYEPCMFSVYATLAVCLTRSLWREAAGVRLKRVNW